MPTIEAVEMVNLEEYFENREGFAQLRPGGQYRRRPAELVNPSLTKPFFVRQYGKRVVSQVMPAEGVARFEGATVMRGSEIVLDDGRLVFESVEKPQHALPAHVLNRSPQVPRGLDRAILVAKPGSRNYGHFLVEMLPRLVLNRAALPDDAPILLRETSRPFAGPMLEHVGFDQGRIEWVDKAPIRVGELHWPTRNTFHPWEHSPHIFSVFRNLREHSGRTNSSRRLFVGRGDATMRKLVNEDAVFAFLEPLGFERIMPGRMPFAEQIAAFAEASLVVGVCGAAMTNLVFMPERGKVVLLAPHPMNGWFYWDLATQSQIDISVVWGRAFGESPDKDADFEIDVRAIPHLG